VDAKAKERTELQSRINTLDSVMTATIREQAQKRNYRFE
jgi:hypothetical protein